MKIELYLAGQPVEIDREIDLTLNRQYTDLNDLTSIIVDYTKSVKIPMSASNNRLFNYIYRLDHRVILGNETFSYDPTVKIDMSLIFNGVLVMEGYAVLSSVDMKNRSYNLNLYSQLGKIFSELKTKKIKEYIPEGTLFENVKMNTEAIGRSVSNDNHSTDWDSTDWTDFFGFTPQLTGDSNIIDKSKYQTVSGETKDMEDVVNKTRGITYSSLYIGDGLDFNAYHEMRSYMCRPYVYVSSLIHLVQNEINRGGYKLTLEPHWFNDSNPYWKDMVYFPKNRIDIGKSVSKGGTLTWNNSPEMMTVKTLRPTVIVNNLGTDYSMDSTGLITIGDDDMSSIVLDCDGIILTDRVNGIKNTIGNFNVDGRWAYWEKPFDRMPIRYLDILDSEDNLMVRLPLCTDRQVIAGDGGRANTQWYNMWKRLRSQNNRIIVPNNVSTQNTSSAGNWCMYTQTYNFGKINIYTNRFRMKLGCSLFDYDGRELGTVSMSDYILSPFKNDNYRTPLWTSGATTVRNYQGIHYVSTMTSNHRSGTYWNIYDILGNDFTPFTWFMDYVKKFRLFFDIDYDTKTITLTDMYFNTIGHKDMICDHGKELTIEPLVNTSRLITWGYESNGSYSGKKYMSKYGVEYGDMEIVTGVNITDSTMKLATSKEGIWIPSPIDDVSWTNLNSTSQIVISNTLLTNDIINTCDDEDRLQYYDFYCFRNPNMSFGKNMWYVSDDTVDMKQSGKYTYLDSASGTGTWDTVVEETSDGTTVYMAKWFRYIPVFNNWTLINTSGKDILYWSTFNEPSEVYDGNLPVHSESVSVSTRWMNWLNELFNANNKKVTCSVHLTYPEFIGYKFNNLFFIENSLFLVNKIIDFNPNSSDPTKVELIQITNPENLK